MTLVYEALIGHILEFVKIAKQTSDKSYFGILGDITGEKGFLGVYDGFAPWGVIQALFKGAVFGGAHMLAKEQLRPLVAKGKIGPRAAEVLAGGIGGGFQGLVLSPTLLLKTRVMTDPIFRKQMGFWETNAQSARVGVRVIRTEGLPALMKGSGVFSAKRVFDWSSRYYFSELVENALYGDVEGTLTTVQRMTASLLGGVLSACATLPMDVATSQIQQASKAGQRVSIYELFASQVREGGFEQVWNFAMRGFTARLLHVAFTTVVMKTVVGIVFDLLFSK